MNDMRSTDLQLVLLDLILESGDFAAHFDGRLTTATSKFLFKVDLLG
jgi:hypothetical protein